jgi:hypothetical protein
MTAPENFSRQIDEVQKEIRELRSSVYGDPQLRQKGLFDRLESLEVRVAELKYTYERERIEEGLLARLEAKTVKLELDYQVTLVYLKGIAGTVGAIFVAVVTALIIALLRYSGAG